MSCATVEQAGWELFPELWWFGEEDSAAEAEGKDPSE